MCDFPPPGDCWDLLLTCTAFLLNSNKIILELRKGESERRRAEKKGQGGTQDCEVSCWGHTGGCTVGSWFQSEPGTLTRWLYQLSERKEASLFFVIPASLGAQEIDSQQFS